jgi:hypothetical protein
MADDFEMDDDDLEQTYLTAQKEGYEETMKYIKDKGLGTASEPAPEKSLEEQLYDAIDKIDVTRAKVLMADGADCNALWRDGEPLLFHAIVMGDVPLVKACLAFGGDLMATDAWGGFSAAHAAVKARSCEMLSFVLKEMMKNGAEKDDLYKECLWVGVCDRHYNLVEGLLMYGISPDMDGWAGKKYYVPILEAARLRDKKMVELLLKYGATMAKDSYMVQRALSE